MDWDKLRMFHAVAEAGGLTQAGERLHLSQSAISRQIRDLEEAVGAALFHRHARGLLLTGEGELLYEATRRIDAEIVAAGARIRDSREEEAGLLTLTTTVGFGSMWLAPRLKALRERAPRLSIHLRLTDRMLDLAMRQADVAVRMRASRQSELIEKALMPVRIGLYASDSYLKGRAAPQSLEDLADHQVLAYDQGAPQPVDDLDWIFKGERPIHPVLTVNNHLGLFQAARDGLGVAPLPDYLAVMAPELQRVAPAVEGPQYMIYLVYPQELRGSPRVVAIKDFLTDEIDLYRKTYRL